MKPFPYAGNEHNWRLDPKEVYQMFRSGMDTLDIAERLCIGEPKVVRMLDTYRNTQRSFAGLPL